MNKAKFWRLIQAALHDSEGDLEEQILVLREKLNQLSAEELVEFQRVLNQLLLLANRWDLWGAAHIINGGCSEEGFSAFRGWLISQGQKVFDGALDDPDTLVDVAEPEAECEGLLELAPQVYKSKTGKPMPATSEPESEPVGEEWSEDDLRDQFPRLWAKFGEEEEE